ncbi:MAG: Coenzyme F420 hydrogenase/dehydrogenase, beta subunit C-terminal domain [bacterium]
MSRKKKEDEVKTFSDLEKEVQAKGLCGQCGGCVSFCSADKLDALEIGEDGNPRYLNEDNCLKCGICYLVCPQIKALDDELQEKLGWKPPIGIYGKVASAKTTDKKIHEICTDGGVVTSLLVYMLDHNLINGAIVSKKTGPFSREAAIVTSQDDLIAAAGSQFSKSTHLEELGGKYTTYSPTISAVKSLEKSHLLHTAMVGTPCQIHTIRKMQILGVVPSHIIKYTLGLFCMENFSFDTLAKERLEKKMNIKMEDVIKLNIKDDLILTLDDGRTLHVPFEEVDQVARPACLVCSDFANEYADISLGGLGSLDGYTTTLIRTTLGERIYSEALRLGYIEERPIKDSETRRTEKTKMMAKIFSFSKRKKLRAEENLRAKNHKK